MIVLDINAAMSKTATARETVRFGLAYYPENIRVVSLFVHALL